MRPLAEDTRPEVERVLIEGYRRMPFWRKLEAVEQMNALIRAMQMAQIRQKHPTASEREVRLRLASRWLGPDLMRRAFGWDPDMEGY